MSWSSPKRFDFIGVGDAQFDMFLELAEQVKVLEDPDTRAQYLALENAQKIPIARLTNVYAVGNSVNASVGASRLGLTSALYTHLGNDDIALRETQVLKDEGISLRYVRRDEDRASNISVVLNYQGERTILVHHEPRAYNLPSLPPCSWMYYSSVATGHAKLHEQIPVYVGTHKAKLAFNPGSFQIKEGINVLRPILGATHALFVNKEEAQTLTGQQADVPRLVKLLHGYGPDIVVVTDGPEGSYASDGKSLRFLEVFPAPVVERTGCGDAYAAAFVCALFYGKDVAEAMRWGTCNSASVLQHIGAREGLLKKDEIEHRLKEHDKFQPTVI
ncbi:MAG: carbohydrate kinase family protein [Candidatus Wildermuthbacteria bacterium]|nr:carbohydrate kinase family protein [Candidatus Wildermuthbacteria bacterium]